MVSKSQIKLITSLHQKKYRKEHKLFIVEGKKAIDELLNSTFEAVYLFSTNPKYRFSSTIATEIISINDLKKISALTTANDCLAVFKIPEDAKIVDENFILALDDIKDPGNFGTIIRMCDWFGIQQIICSNETVDLYNPKVVQATMGSISRVKISYIDLKEYLTKTKLPVFGAFMDGKNVYKTTLPTLGVLVMGNEANGISSEIEALVTERISIPRFGTLQQTESLNVATATAILLSEFRRTL